MKTIGEGIAFSDIYYRTKLTITADSTLTKVAPYKSFKPNRATTFPCFSLRPFTAPAIIPMDEKFANDTRNTEMIPKVRSLIAA
jgi:hypothetical protein